MDGIDPDKQAEIESLPAPLPAGTWSDPCPGLETKPPLVSHRTASSGRRTPPGRRFTRVSPSPKGRGSIRKGSSASLLSRPEGIGTIRPSSPTEARQLEVRLHCSCFCGHCARLVAFIGDCQAFQASLSHNEKLVHSSFSRTPTGRMPS
jgi:hypothetical protein